MTILIESVKTIINVRENKRTISLFIKQKITDRCRCIFGDK